VMGETFAWCNAGTDFDDVLRHHLILSWRHRVESLLYISTSGILGEKPFRFSDPSILVQYYPLGEGLAFEDPLMLTLQCLQCSTYWCS
jgi:hypothetical protein